MTTRLKTNDSKTSTDGEITRYGIFDCQVCVPKDWTNEQVVKFANSANPCGTKYGWMIRLGGDPALLGMPERVQCEQHSGNVHIMMDC